MGCGVGVGKLFTGFAGGIVAAGGSVDIGEAESQVLNGSVVPSKSNARLGSILEVAHELIQTASSMHAIPVKRL
jgi:hypothetical protein